MTLAGCVATLIAIPWILIALLPTVFVLAPLGLPTLGLIVLYSRAKFHLARSFKKRVLIADDDEISIAPLLSALARASVEICRVSNGRELYRALRSQKFDLMFLDLFMPGLDGEGVLTLGERYTQAQEPLSVVVYTGSHERLLKLEKRSYGRFHVDAIWPKNMRFAELRSRLKDELNVAT